ncbi:MAG: MFS transporter [Rhodobacteraceae bacterium]|nr:MFS transporter [Paracoccaceae bacterium]
MQDGQTARRIWGWYFFDWASQPYNTLLVTFIFGPYLKDLMGQGAEAQAAWGYAMGLAGIVIACLAPVLGSIADHTGPRMRLRFIWICSGLYVVGALELWEAAPDHFDLWRTLGFFGLGLVGMELATIFTNAMLPELGPRSQLGRISGTGWAFGNLGGLISLIFVLLLLAESGPSGHTLLGIPPILGLDPAVREGTRAVGPFTALWYVVFMIPFFAWVREVGDPTRPGLATAARRAWPELRNALIALSARRSLATFLAASMFYRDALNGLYTFGGIYAAGVLGWTVTDVGIFGIVAIIAATVVGWIGGQCDARFGPKAVMMTALVTLCLVTCIAVTISRDGVLGFSTRPGSPWPDVAFYAVGAIIGAAGSVLQASSRGMMVRQADPARITQGFGLYALTGKATAFLAPFSVALVTDLSGSQQIGIFPLLALFLVGLILLVWVRAEGDTSR